MHEIRPSVAGQNHGDTRLNRYSDILEPRLPDKRTGKPSSQAISRVEVDHKGRNVPRDRAEYLSTSKGYISKSLLKNMA